MEKVEKLETAADIADVVKATLKEHARGIIDEALKPFVEKGEEFRGYADSIIELERKKAELETPPERRGYRFARAVRALAMGKGNAELGLFEAGRAWGADDPVVRDLVARQKALTASSPSGAGGLIPQTYSSEFIELLRGRARVRSIARVVPMPMGNLTLRRQTAAATAYYEGESVAVEASQQSIGALNLSFKKLIAITPIGNSLLRFAGPEADRLVRDDLLIVVALKEDLAFLVGDGTSNTPMGILNLVAAANKFADAGVTVAQQMGDYVKAVKQVEESDVQFEEEDGYFIMAARVFWGIYKTAGSTEDATFPFKAMLEQKPPRLLGYEVKKTSQAKKTLTGGTETTEAATNDRIFFCHGPSLLLGDSLNLEVEAFPGGAYVQSGTVVSGVSRDETVVRVISEHDFNMRYAEAASVITGVSVGNF